MSGVVDRIIERDKELSVIPYGIGNYHEFLQNDRKNSDGSNPSGIAIEEGMLLYSLIRCFRPDHVLETGTNLGISARFIGLALEDNHKGELVTIEHDGTVAKLVWEKLQHYARIRLMCGKVEDFDPKDTVFDFMWLDTELNTRYAELERFYEHASPGCVMCVHDMCDLDMPEFGGVPEKMRSLLHMGRLRVIPIHTEHGVTIFQKHNLEDGATKYIEGCRHD